MCLASDYFCTAFLGEARESSGGGGGGGAGEEARGGGAAAPNPLPSLPTTSLI